MSVAKTYADSMIGQEYGHFPGRHHGAIDITSLLQSGGLIELDVGEEYTLTGNVVIDYNVPKITLRGAGRQRTIINVTGTIEFRTVDDDGDYELSQWHSFEGLTFMGPSGVRTLDFMTINFANRLRFTDVEWRRMRTAITANRLWDSDFLHCSWHNCGVGVAYPAVIFQKMTDPPDSDPTYATNNVSITNCMFEPNEGPSLVLREATRSCRIMGNKFHGPLPSEEWDHLIIEDGSYVNEVLGNVFANTDGVGLTLDDADGNLIIGNRFGSCGTGILLANSPASNAIVANSFGIGTGQSNGTDIDGSTVGNEVANNPGYTP